MIYEQTFNMSFYQKMEINQYKTDLTSAIQGSPRENLHQELGLETSQQQLWYRKHCYF